MKDSPKTAYHWITPLSYVFYGKIMQMIILWNAGIKNGSVFTFASFSCVTK